MKVLAFIKVVPIGTSTSSLSNYVAEVVKVIRSLGINYQITSFGTGVEVDTLEDLTKLLNLVSERLRSMNVSRILMDVSLDLRYDKEISLEHKVRAVHEKLART